MKKHIPVSNITNAELDLLSLNARNALTARAFNNLPYTKIADQQGVALGTIKSRLNRARALIAARRAAAKAIAA